MGGLLYKNYVVVRGKLLVFGLLGLTILFLLLRLLLWGSGACGRRISGGQYDR